MEEGRKKIRMCLIFVVTAAVIIGCIYYFHDVKGNHGVNEGTLIKRTEKQMEEKDEQMRFAASDKKCGGGKAWLENQIRSI